MDTTKSRSEYIIENADNARKLANTCTREVGLEALSVEVGGLPVWGRLGVRELQRRPELGEECAGPRSGRSSAGLS